MRHRAGGAPLKPELVLVALRRALRAAADPRRRRALSWYAPSRLEVLGVPTPALRSAARAAAKSLAASPRQRLVVLRALHDSGVMEERLAAYEIVERLSATDLALTAKQIEALGEGNDNWICTDAYGCLVAGPAWRRGALEDAAVRRWARSKDLWWRRTALVATVALNVTARGARPGGDPARTLDIVERLTRDPEDLVQKALSWALRALAQQDPALVRRFLAAQGTELSRRVIREVGNKLRTGKKDGRRRRR